ncbi:hypothetical protein [Dictyobacter kobayashii]|uniref:Uncharacterized protein n=1 Tax=Dictyobacter kobayashii TaxID=2014872 RepID=A0A402ATA7_9CHLR|nr:hypothetical protein [Dictyobacter kobayashii]GCE22321.1 hypothetical protein KDK_61210 [Dictyobacter kobayashii]
MLNLSISYKMLVRIVGILLLFYGLFLVFSALLAQTNMSGDQPYSGLLLFWDTGRILSYIFYGFPLSCLLSINLCWRC